MKGQVGFLIFGALLAYGIASALHGELWTGGACLVAAMLTFAFWSVDRSAR